MRHYPCTRPFGRALGNRETGNAACDMDRTGFLEDKLGHRETEIPTGRPGEGRTGGRGPAPRVIDGL
jgi:hypothetical protein